MIYLPSCTHSPSHALNGCPELERLRLLSYMKISTVGTNKVPYLYLLPRKYIKINPTSVRRSFALIGCIYNLIVGNPALKQTFVHLTSTLGQNSDQLYIYIVPEPGSASPTDNMYTNSPEEQTSPREARNSPPTSQRTKPGSYGKACVIPPRL